ncbi:MAG: hypothetical protein GY722_28080 [bacterium]|nr:hypothetical protein [bacterium]
MGSATNDGSLLVRTRRRFWAYSKEYGETLFSLIVATGVAIYSLIWVISVETLAGWTLLVLAFLSSSLMRARAHRTKMMSAAEDLQNQLARLTPNETAQIHVSRDQVSDNQHLLRLLENTTNIEKALFLEFSGRFAFGIMQDVVRRFPKCEIEILVKHPDSVGEEQRKVIMAQLEALQQFVCARHSDRVTVRCYKAPYSVRGRKFEPHLINVGWYTPWVDNKGEVLGHTNPIITAELQSQQGLALARMYDGLFRALWTDPDNTEDIEHVLAAAAAAGN